MRLWRVLMITTSILLYLFAFVGLHTIYNQPASVYMLFDLELSSDVTFDLVICAFVGAFVLQLTLNLKEKFE